MGLIPWRPLSPTFGAEAQIDLSSPLGPEMLDAWRELFERRHLILVRCGALSAGDHQRAVGAFGRLIASEKASAFVSTDPEKGSLGTTEVAFHSDFSFTPHPLDGISLYGLSLVDDASSTRWISAIDGYAHLPEALRERIAGLQVLNVISNDRCERNRFQQGPSPLPATAHPLVRYTNAGQPFVYANEAQSDHVVGLSPAESDAVLDALFAALYDPARIVEHRWRKGDLVVWNNQVLQHARGDVSGIGERTLRRFEFGESALSDQFPEFMAMIRSSYGRGERPVMQP